MTEYRLHGPPGTGKTRTLATRWVPKAVEKFGSKSVVICSLTRTAATEIASRDLPIPTHNVGTLHALAFRSLGRPPIAEGEVKEWNELFPAFKLSGGKPSMDEPEIKANSKNPGDELMSIAQVYRHNRIPRSDWRPDVLSFQRRWEDWMDAEGLVDFTGLMETALDEVPCAPGNPDVFIMDEAQDCSVLELELVRKWTARASYAVLAGDGDQAIYGWRGGSARAFLSPQIPEENNYHLTQSYRVPCAVHAVASKWIDKASYRYAVEYEPRDFKGSVEYSPGNGRHVAPLVSAATEAVNQGKTVMILATCGFMLNGVIASLRRSGVPFHNPHRTTNGAWNPLRGGAQRLLSYLAPDPSVYGEDAHLWTWADAKAWTELVRAKGVLSTGGKAWINDLGGDDKRKFERMSEEDGMAIFGEQWEQLKNVFSLGESLNWLENNLLASRRSFMEYALAVARSRGARTLLDEPKLTVGSIHSVKGAQADVVFLLPDLSPASMREWATRGDQRDGIVRTFYVGMTRARERLVLASRWSGYSVDWRA